MRIEPLYVWPYHLIDLIRDVHKQRETVCQLFFHHPLVVIELPLRLADVVLDAVAVVPGLPHRLHGIRHGVAGKVVDGPDDDVKERCRVGEVPLDVLVGRPSDVNPGRYCRCCCHCLWFSFHLMYSW